jgi:hypothetical protein
MRSLAMFFKQDRELIDEDNGIFLGDTSYKGEPPHFIVIAVMSVICLYLRNSSVTVIPWCIPGPSRHRHRGEGLGRRFSRYRDGDDAHDAHLRTFSEQGAHLYLKSP